jgi:hypothetical protein
MRRLGAFLALPVIAVVACETPVPTASPDDPLLAVYAGADIELKGIDYSTIAPSEMAGEQCQWIVDGDAMVTLWSRPDCEMTMGVTMWIEYTARLTPGLWRIGLNAINTGAGLGDDPTWYPEFHVGSSLGPAVIRIPASDTEVHSGYTEYRVTSEGDFTIRFWWLNDKWDFDSEPPRDANIKIVSVFFAKVPGKGARPVHWSVLDLPCPEGTDPVDGQLQSAQPLDPASGLVVIGTSTVCQGGTEEPFWTPDWYVYDLSSGAAVLVDAFDTEADGYNVGVHSPVSSRVAFGVDGAALTIYDDGFRKVALPDGVWGMDVWAGSSRSVWISGGTVRWETADPWGTGGAGKIVRYDGEEFVVEYAGGTAVLDIWGHGPRALFASTMNGILQRSADGTWSEAELPETCGGTHWGDDALVGRNPRDVWAARYTCLLHFDGGTWSTVPVPEVLSGGVPVPVWVQAVLPMSATALLVAGQGSQVTPAGSEYIGLWGSVDGGQTWRQISDPVFTSLEGPSYRSFFALGATQGMQRLLLPTIRGRRLFVGTPMDFAAITQLQANRRAAGKASHETVKH